MAIAGRRRVPAGFTNVTYRTVGRRQSPRSRNRLVPPGTAMSAVPAYEDDDERWYALRTAVPPRLSHRLRRSELLHSEPRACATACVRLSRADPVGSTGRLPPFFRRLPADNGSLPHNGAYPNTVCGRRNPGVSANAVGSRPGNHARPEIRPSCRITPTLNRARCCRRSPRQWT